MIPIRKTWIKIYDREIKEILEGSNYSSKHP